MMGLKRRSIYTSKKLYFHKNEPALLTEQFNIE